MHPLTDYPLMEVAECQAETTDEEVAASPQTHYEGVSCRHKHCWKRPKWTPMSHTGIAGACRLTYREASLLQISQSTFSCESPAAVQYMFRHMTPQQLAAVKHLRLVRYNGGDDWSMPPSKNLVHAFPKLERLTVYVELVYTDNGSPFDIESAPSELKIASAQRKMLQGMLSLAKTPATKVIVTIHDRTAAKLRRYDVVRRYHSLSSEEIKAWEARLREQLLAGLT